MHAGSQPGRQLTWDDLPGAQHSGRTGVQLDRSAAVWLRRNAAGQEHDGVAAQECSWTGAWQCGCKGVQLDRSMAVWLIRGMAGQPCKGLAGWVATGR